MLSLVHNNRQLGLYTSMTAGGVHIAKDTIYGRRALCGREAMFAVYPNEVADLPHEEICAECRRLLDGALPGRLSSEKQHPEWHRFAGSG